MGKTFKDRRDRDSFEDKAERQRKRQEARRDKRIQRGEFVSRRVERAKGGEE